MDFAFPPDIFYNGRIVKKVNAIKYKGDLLNINNLSDTTINIDNTEYYFTYLNIIDPYSKGGNSIIMKLFQIEYFDENDPDFDAPDKIIKILKFPIDFGEKAIHKRFNLEIEALNKCKEIQDPSIVEIFDFGTCKLNVSGDKNKRKIKDYLYYTMEPADTDLSEYIKNNPNIDDVTRISLCTSITKGIMQLHKLGYYHRDLKPDNILVFGDNWKIADLGLIGHRDTNFDIDRDNDLIGPKGWLSPESVNKWLCGDNDYKDQHDCIIDDQSDIFQLGKLFCFIMQGNNPMGILKIRDLNLNNNRMKHLIKKMLHYPKSSRAKNLHVILNLIKPIEQELLLHA